MTKTLLITALVGLAAWGQVNGPTPGYVFDRESKQLRPVRGMVGSAYLGSALIDESAAASASPDGTMAIASRLGTVELVRGFDSETSAWMTLSQEPGPVLFAWSGHDVAAVFTETKKASVWRGVDAKTDAMSTIDLAAIGGAITAALLDGDRLILVSADGLYLAKGGQTSRILESSDISSVILDGANLFAADRGNGQIVLVRNYAAEASAEKFADVATPVGMQRSKGSLLVASAESRRVEAYDVATMQRTGAVDLDFQPTRLEAFGSSRLGLLNARSADEPLYVLDSSDSLQVFFVPAGREQ